MARTPKGPKITIDVTEEIIDYSIKHGQRDSRHCMIADAVRASFPDAKAVSVDLATIRLTDPKRGIRYTYLTPRIAQVELVRFDRGIRPAPYKFQIRSPQVTRSGTGRQVDKKPQTPAQQRARTKAGHDLNAKLRKSKIVARKTEAVPDRVGGKTPPLQVGQDNVPFSRRRAFGLRALEY